MDGPEALIQALRREDDRLRDLLGRFPGEACELAGRGLPSLKEALADIAFWDARAVRVFQRRLAGWRIVTAHLDLERQNRAEVRRARDLSFEEVLHAYSLATRELIEFLQARWESLKPRYRRQFALPLRHRRFHRELLESLLLQVGGRAAAG